MFVLKLHYINKRKVGEKIKEIIIFLLYIFYRENKKSKKIIMKSKFFFLNFNIDG